MYKKLPSTSQLSKLAAATFCAALLAQPVKAQTIEGTDLRTHLSRALISATGTHMTIERLPVISTTGAVSYYDLSLKLAVINGLLALHVDQLAASPIPPIVSLPFKGIYQDLGSEVCYETTAAAPYPGGRAVFVLQETASLDGCYQGSEEFRAEFTTGPVDGHPAIDERYESYYSDETYTYGDVVTRGALYSGAMYNVIGSNYLLGARVQGNGDLKIGRFTSDSAPDYSAILKRIQ